MTSELQHGQSELREVRRILTEWIADAAATLGRKKISDTDVHGTRKNLKKARAALRLLRGSIGEIAYQRDNTALRDAARPLGFARDSKVLTAALDALVDGDSKRFKPDRFRRMLRKEQQQARRALTASTIGKQRRALQAVVKRSARWRMQGDDWTVVADGVKRIYRRSRKGLARARESRDSEQLHDWRKQVKYLWHQVQILRPLRPDKLDALADRCHKLADRLGDDHDLAVLRAKICAHAEAFERNGELDELLSRLDRRRAQLQDEAFALGKKIFARKPRAFVQRLHQYRKEWLDSVPE